MDNKTFCKLFFFIFNCESFYFATRMILCAILEYGSIFTKYKETTFELYYTKFNEMYKVTYDKLKQVLDYFKKLDFLAYDEKNTYFIITLFTLNMTEFRDRYLVAKSRKQDN